MKIYKEKQFLIFDFEDGKTVKYDFATKTAIGKKGLPVKNLCSQLRGLTIDELCDCCTDKNYGNFLRFVKNKAGCSNGYCINNIGTILNKVPYFSNFEQLFSAGIGEIVYSNFKYTINDIPKGLIKLCKNHNIKLSNELLEYYKQNPNAYLLAYELQYESLNDSYITEILMSESSEKEPYITAWGYNTYRWITVNSFNKLTTKYGYTPKALLNYLDYCMTYEAINDMNHLLKELIDYASMMKEVSDKFDKYPRNFLTTHQIAIRNYDRLKKEFEEDKFKNRINKEMEHTFGEYRFIYPDSTQDIKDEAVQMHNCVSSYIDRVIDGQCHILFLRKKNNLKESLVTIEVRNNQIVQALQKFNNKLTEEQSEIIKKWNTWYSNKLKKENKEREELKNVS